MAPTTDGSRTMDVDLSCDFASRWAMAVQGPPGRVCMEIAELREQDGLASLADREVASDGTGAGKRMWSTKPLVIRTLWMELQPPFINQWFGTRYGEGR